MDSDNNFNTTGREDRLYTVNWFDNSGNQIRSRRLDSSNVPWASQAIIHHQNPFTWSPPLLSTTLARCPLFSISSSKSVARLLRNQYFIIVFLIHCQPLLHFFFSVIFYFLITRETSLSSPSATSMIQNIWQKPGRWLLFLFVEFLIPLTRFKVSTKLPRTRPKTRELELEVMAPSESHGRHR